MPEVGAEEERRFMETSQGGMLDAERARASFDVEKLTNLIDGGAEETRRRRSVRGAIESDPFMDSRGRIFKTRRERYVEAMKRFQRGEKIVRGLGEDGKDVRNFMWVKDAPYLDDFPIALHFLMFMPNLKITCTEEQLQKWIPPSLSFKIIGCYAQTELGHGSNVRGIETTATFIPETVTPLLLSLPHNEQRHTPGHAKQVPSYEPFAQAAPTHPASNPQDEFEIHTPTLSATKWWPGSLGCTANTAIVFARLILEGKVRPALQTVIFIKNSYFPAG